MARLYIMGSANAIPSMEQENSYFFLQNESKSVLVDCGSNAFVKLQTNKVNINDISDIILTYFHPDHVAGLPLMLMDWWLLGRKEPLVIHGLKFTLDRAQKMMDLFDWKNWPNFFPVTFNELPENYHKVISSDQIEIHSTPVKHLIPTLGLRMNLKEPKITVAYSCDSEPCDGVIQLARNANVLVHEASGEAKGHSSAQQCGMDAQKAGVDKLVLIHYPADLREEDMIKEARKEFSGEIILAKDMMTFG